MIHDESGDLWTIDSQNHNLAVSESVVQRVPVETCVQMLDFPVHSNPRCSSLRAGCVRTWSTNQTKVIIDNYFILNFQRTSLNCCLVPTNSFGTCNFTAVLPYSENTFQQVVTCWTTPPRRRLSSVFPILRHSFIIVIIRWADARQPTLAVFCQTDVISVALNVFLWTD